MNSNPRRSESRERAVRQPSPAVYTDLFDSAPVAFFLLDSKHAIRRVNAAATELLSEPKTHLIRSKFARFIAPQSHDAFFRCMGRMTETGHRCRCEISMRKADGIDICVEVQSVVLTGDDTNPVSLLAVTDITERRKMEEELRRHAHIFANMPDAVISSDRQLRIVTWNRSAEQMYGWQASEVIGKLVKEVIPVQYPDSNRYAVFRELYRRGFRVGEVVHRRRDGTIINVLMSAGLLRDTGNSVVGTVFIARDITDRKKTEEELTETNRQLTHILESTSDGFINIGRDRVVTHFNRAAERLLGRSRTDLIGRNVFDAFPEAKSPFFAEKAALVRGSGAHLSFDVYLTMEPYRNWYDVQVFPHEAGTSVFFRATTKQKEAEAERERMLRELTESKRDLEAEQGILNTIMENTGAMLAYFDPQFNFVRVNRAYARASGHSPADLVGKNHFALFPDDENQRIFELVRDIGQPITFHDKMFVFADQPERGVSYWDWSLVPVKDAGGKTLALVLSLVETTERVRAEEKLRSFERLATLGELAGNISHELRNPLATIDSSVFYLRSHLKEAENGAQHKEKLETHLERIHSGVLRSTAIIQSLLNLTEMREPRTTRLDLRPFVKEVLTAGNLPPGIRLVENVTPAETIIEADPEQLRMALQNVIENAVQAMDESGTLAVAIIERGNQAELSISDTGPGIPPENLNRIFQPLFTTKAKGIGLGLSIARLIIERHGGTIRARSTQGGATIVIRLPVHGEREQRGKHGGTAGELRFSQ